MEPPPLPDDVPPPLKPPSLFTGFARAALITFGMGVGFAAGIVIPIAIPSLCGFLSGTDSATAHGSELLAVGGITFLSLLAIAVLTWRRGLRGLPIGLMIGASLSTFLVVCCDVI